MIGLTGGRGVLGRRLLATLEARGIAVTSFGGDIREAEAVKRWVADCSTVVHAAAIVPTGRVGADPAAAITVNVAGTATIAAAAATTGARLIYVSTSHVYRSSARPLTEEAPIDPVSLYGLSKWQGEQWCARLASEVLVARLFSYFDARQGPSYLGPALHDRIACAAPGAELPLFGYDSVRDIADARWLSERLADLIALGTSGIVNVGTGQPHSIAAIARTLATVAGRPDIRWVPADDKPGDMLVADVTRLNMLFDVPAFDLGAAFGALVSERTPK